MSKPTDPPKPPTEGEEKEWGKNVLKKLDAWLDRQGTPPTDPPPVPVPAPATPPADPPPAPKKGFLDWLL